MKALTTPFPTGVLERIEVALFKFLIFIFMQAKALKMDCPDPGFHSLTQFDVWEGGTQLYTTLGHISGSPYSYKEQVVKHAKTWQIHPVLQLPGWKVRTHNSFNCMYSRLSLEIMEVMVEPYLGSDTSLEKRFLKER